MSFDREVALRRARGVAEWRGQTASLVAEDVLALDAALAAAEQQVEMLRDALEAWVERNEVLGLAIPTKARAALAAFTPAPDGAE